MMLGISPGLRYLPASGESRLMSTGRPQDDYESRRPDSGRGRTWVAEDRWSDEDSRPGSGQQGSGQQAADPWAAGQEYVGPWGAQDDEGGPRAPGYGHWAEPEPARPAQPARRERPEGSARRERPEGSARRERPAESARRDRHD